MMSLHNTGNNELYTLPKGRLKIFRDAYIVQVQGLAMWNSINTSILNCNEHYFQLILAILSYYYCNFFFGNQYQSFYSQMFILDLSC